MFNRKITGRWPCRTMVPKFLDGHLRRPRTDEQHRAPLRLGELQVGQVDTIVWQVDYGGMPYEVAAQSLELFATEVLPKLLS